MPGPNEIVADYAALEGLAARLARFADSFLGVERLADLSSAATGQATLAGEYGEFRSKWLANRHLIAEELQSAASVAREALVTYRKADTSLARGTGS